MTDSLIPLSLPIPAEYATTASASPNEEEEAVVALFDLYRQRIFRYVLSFGLTPHDSEDVVQESFIALFSHLRMGRDRTNLRGWIFRVAHNLALKRRMSDLKAGETVCTDELTFEVCPDHAPNPEQTLAFQQRQARLMAVVKALPELDERCLRLRAEGLKYREIADVLGVSLGAVSLALTRSLERLKRADLG